MNRKLSFQIERKINASACSASDQMLSTADLLS